MKICRKRPLVDSSFVVFFAEYGSIVIISAFSEVIIFKILFFIIIIFLIFMLTIPRTAVIGDHF